MFIQINEKIIINLDNVTQVQVTDAEQVVVEFVNGHTLTLYGADATKLWLEMQRLQRPATTTPGGYSVVSRIKDYVIQSRELIEGRVPPASRTRHREALRADADRILADINGNVRPKPAEPATSGAFTLD